MKPKVDSMYIHRSNRFRLAGLILALTLGSWLLGVSLNAQSPAPAPVTVATVIEKTVAGQISLIGSTEAIKTSRVAAEVEGIVEQFPTRVGDFVHKGDTLAQLRDTALRYRLKGLQADRQRIAADMQLAQRDLERAEELKTSKIMPPANYDKFLFQHQALQQTLAKSEAELELVRYQIEQKRILSPFSGFIAAEHREVGEWVQAGNEVVTLLDLSRIRIQVEVPERYAVNFAPGDTVFAVLRNISTDRLPGKIDAISPQADATARSFMVRIELENRTFRIKGGMEVEVTFNLASTQKALVVPKDAIVTAGTNRLVYTVSEGKAMPVGIEIVGYYQDDAAVIGDLKPGMPVVVRGNERLRPAQPVTVGKP